MPSMFNKSPSWSTKVCVYRAYGPTDAHLIRDLLVSDGIPVEMRGEQLTSLQGAIPLPDAWPTLWVLEHNGPRAQALINEVEAEPVADDWRCECGESNTGVFGSCWQCSRDRPGLTAAPAPVT